MYKGFEIINLTKDFFGNREEFEEWVSFGKCTLNDYATLLDVELPKLIINETIVDGNKLASEWFKEIEADIFISHSHNDLSLALALAGWLYDRWKIRSFVDSQVWGSADKLLRKIDNKYCENGPSERTYNYKKRNFTTSHVHNILLMSIARVMNKTECFIFLNTEESIPLKRGIDESTLSPWLYSEIEISSMLKPQSLKRTKCFEEGGLITPLFESAGESFEAAYSLNKSHLLTIDQNHLYFLEKEAQKLEKYELLDLLYYLHYKYISI